MAARTVSSRVSKPHASSGGGADIGRAKAPVQPKPESHPHAFESGMVLYTLADFRAAVARGHLNADDGTGYMASATRETNQVIVADPTAFVRIPTWCTHIAWYNK